MKKVIDKQTVFCTLVLSVFGIGFVFNALNLQRVKHPAPLLAAAAPAEPVRTVAATPAQTEAQVPQEAPKTSVDPILIAVQTGLSRQGFYKGAIDGLAGPATEAAILTYQRQNGLELTGVASSQLAAHIRGNGQGQAQTQPLQTVSVDQSSPRSSDAIADLLSQGQGQVQNQPSILPQRDETVRTLQIKLKQVGFDPGPLDGVFGAGTERALKSFQSAHGLPATGQVDATVLLKLFSAAEQAAARPQSSGG